MNSTTSHAIRHERCPRCADEGNDRRGDNLAVYSDGHKYCFRCHYYGHPPQSLSSLSHRISSLQPHSSSPLLSYLSSDHDFSPEYGTKRLPAPCIRWLIKYHVTPLEALEAGIWFDRRGDYLVMPIHDDSTGALVHVTKRYFGSRKDMPKYITRGFKTGYHKLFPGKVSEPWIFVEDFVSALRVGKQYPCTPLLGTFAPKPLIQRASASTRKLLFWLDRDAAASSILQTQKARQFVKYCGTIVTELDPKCYKDEEINDIVLRHLEGIPEV